MTQLLKQESLLLSTPNIQHFASRNPSLSSGFQMLETSSNKENHT